MILAISTLGLAVLSEGATPPVGWGSRSPLPKSPPGRPSVSPATGTSCVVFMPALKALNRIVQAMWEDMDHELDFYSLEGGFSDLVDPRVKATIQKRTIQILADWSLHPQDRVMVIDLFEIFPPHRGRGHGRETVQRMENFAALNKAKAILLQAAQIDVLHSLPFWEKMGYHEINPHKNVYGDVVMIKVLGRSS